MELIKSIRRLKAMQAVIEQYKAEAEMAQDIAKLNSLLQNTNALVFRGYNGSAKAEYNEW